MIKSCALAHLQSYIPQKEEGGATAMSSLYATSQPVVFAVTGAEIRNFISDLIDRIGQYATGGLGWFLLCIFVSIWLASKGSKAFNNGASKRGSFWAILIGSMIGLNAIAVMLTTEGVTPTAETQSINEENFNQLTSSSIGSWGQIIWALLWAGGIATLFTRPGFAPKLAAIALGFAGFTLTLLAWDFLGGIAPIS